MVTASDTLCFEHQHFCRLCCSGIKPWRNHQSRAGVPSNPLSKVPCFTFSLLMSQILMRRHQNSLLLFFVSTLPSSVTANPHQMINATTNPADGKILALPPPEPAGPTHYRVGKAHSHEILTLDGPLNTRIIRIISSLCHEAGSR